MPPALPGEDAGQYTDRLTGADGTGRRPYDHKRNRQCSIGYHGECSDPQGETCECPCHPEMKALAEQRDRIHNRWIVREIQAMRAILRAMDETEGDPR